MNRRNRRIAAVLALAAGIVSAVLLVSREQRLVEVVTVGGALRPDLGGASSGRSRGVKPLPQLEIRADPLVAAQRVMEMPPGPEQDRALREAALLFVQQDPDGALAWALELPDAATRGAALEIVMPALVQRDARGTLARLAALPSSHAADEALAVAAGHWARDNAPDALAWLQEIHDATQRARLLGSIGYELAETDPTSALRVAANTLSGEEQRLFTASIVIAWAARDPHAAIGWAREQRDPSLRDQLLRQIVTGVALAAPAEAAQLISQLPPGAAREGAALEIVSRWGERDARAAADWAAAFADESLRNRAVAQTVSQWSAADFGSAARWVLALPGGETRAHAIAAHVAVLKIEGTRAAAEWLASLPASDQRANLIEDLAREWLAGNRTAAVAWLEQTALPPAQKDRLLAAVPVEGGVQ